jgi:Asp-tRNA(Asn)/Glu-tRNA(Gln) amidotransferase C subunit
MELDFTTLTANQIKIVAKIQNMALIDLTEKTSEMLELHLGLLFELLENTIEIWDEGDDGDDEPVDKPSPLPEDSRKY